MSDLAQITHVASGEWGTDDLTQVEATCMTIQKISDPQRMWQHDFSFFHQPEISGWWLLEGLLTCDTSHQAHD